MNSSGLQYAAATGAQKTETALYSAISVRTEPGRWTRCFVDPESVGFRIKEPVRPSVYVCMTQYDGSMPNVLTAFPPAEIKNTLGEYLSSLGLSQLRIAETEKYAHVTFFFNGGKEVPYPHEDRILIPSPKVADL